jgi:CheY-like chemotaxis protein
MEGTRSKPLVLLVDDNDDIRDMMRLILEDGGFSVIEAANGMQAVEKAASDPPSVILMDIAMPLMDGIEAAQEIRSRDGLGYVPIIAVTAHGREYHDKAMEVGFNEVMQKPIDVFSLNSAINRWVH